MPANILTELAIDRDGARTVVHRCRSLQDLAKPAAGMGRGTLGGEDERRRGRLLAPEAPQRPKLAAGQRVRDRQHRSRHRAARESVSFLSRGQRLSAILRK